MSEAENRSKKIIVTGASGMLGTSLYQVFKDAGYGVISTDLTPLDTWTHTLDIRDAKAVRKLAETIRPDYIFNLAALTDVEYCEIHPEEAYDTNTKGAENVAIVCKDLDIPLIHISTAGVFDGKKETPYIEEDQPNPVNVYGKSKYETEKIVQNLLDKYFIFRAGWMMGSGDRDKKFVKKMLNLVNAGHTTIYGLVDTK